LSDEPGSLIRVLVVGMTGVLGDLVRDALRAPDVELLETADVGAGTRGANAVICADRTLAEVCDVLYANPRVRVLTVEDDGRRGSVHELVPHSHTLGELSPAVLLAAVRSSVR
jgi:hypothetical protein